MSEIDTMEGEELDRLVAIAMRGRPILTTFPVTPHAYSTDPAAMVEVMERFRMIVSGFGREWAAGVETGPPYEARVTLTEDRHARWYAWCDVAAIGATPMLAVARCAAKLGAFKEVISRTAEKHAATLRRLGDETGRG